MPNGRFRIYFKEQAFASACLLFFTPFAVFGSALEPSSLSLNHEDQGTLIPGVPTSKSLELNVGDYANVAIDLKHSSALVQVFDRAGTKIRAENLNDVGNIAFVAPATGQYRIGLIATTPGTYAILWKDRISFEQRLASLPTAPRLEGPRIKALRAALAAGDPAAVPTFWAEVKARGIPLVEPLAGHPNQRLVTFLWKGNASTRRVLLMWRLMMEVAPERCSLSQVGNADVWFATFKMSSAKRMRYRYVENGPDLPTDGKPASSENMGILWSMSEVDPLNPRRVEAADTEVDADRFHGSSAFELPDVSPEPWLEHRAGVPTGAIITQTIHSALLGNDRTVRVYTPPGYSAEGKPYPVVYLFDGGKYLNDFSVPTVLDNLLAEHRLPSFIAVLIDNAPGARIAELEGNRTFTDFMAMELVPWVRHSYNVTADPRCVVIGGLSAGGLAAAYTAYCHPEIFGNVLSQSGSFWWRLRRNAADRNNSDPEPPFLPSLFIKSPLLPIRFYLSAGTDEIDTSGGGGGILIPNREFRDVLLAKGYEVFYKEVDGEHDVLNWRPTFPNALLLLAKGMTEN